MLFEFLRMIFGSFFLSLRISGNSFQKPLSAADERKYLELNATGDKEAKDILIEHNLRLVAHIIKKYYSSSKEQDDLISIGTIGLIKAVGSFKPEKGARLATYAARCIENEILMYFRSQRRNAGEVLLSDPIESDGDGNNIVLLDIVSIPDTMLEDLSDKDNRQKLLEYIEKGLEPREREIIRMRYGINYPQPLPQNIIARKFGISRSYISRIEKKAVEKLKKMFEEGENRVRAR